MADQEHLTLPASTPHGEGEASLPAVADAADVDVIDAPARWVYTAEVIRVVSAAAHHPHARRAGRHAGYVAAGIVVAARRRKRRRTFAGEMAAIAAARGDDARAEVWAKLDHQQRQERRESRRQAAESAGALLALLPRIVKGAAVAMAAISVLMFMKGGIRGFEEPWLLAAAVASAAYTGAVVAWAAAPYAAPAALLAWLYYLGRTGDGLAPKWARTSAQDDIDLAIDELTITHALANLRIPQIRDYLKADRPLQFTVGCRQEGRGTYCEVRLPGVPAEKIARRRQDLAAGVHRLAKEVWPSVGSEAAVLKLWIADKGALEEGAGPYPLLAEGFTDVFKGLPFGRSLRGDPVKIPVIGRNSICGGMPEQGKSNGARVVAAGYTLDIITELRLYIPDANFDFERFKPRCARYVMGAEDEHVERILGEMEELKEEIQRRGQLLIDAEAEEVTYELAHAGIGLHPVFALIEEAHVVIQHHKYGKSFKQLLPEIVKLDRKRGIHVAVSTQAPTKDSMPRDVTRNCTVGIAYAVGDHVANDALLGQGAYAGGHRATELIPGSDRGTALVKGFAGEARSEMVQAYRVSGRSGDDQVTPIVQRALAAMAEEGRAVPGTVRGPLAIEQRNLLDDLAEVTKHRGGKVRVSELPDLLHNLAPSWGPYRGLNGVQLRKELMAAGVPTTNPGNVPTLDLDELATAISKREVS